jgi:hypothetical protein
MAFSTSEGVAEVAAVEAFLSGDNGANALATPETVRRCLR